MAMPKKLRIDPREYEALQQIVAAALVLASDTYDAIEHQRAKAAIPQALAQIERLRADERRRAGYRALREGVPYSGVYFLRSGGLVKIGCSGHMAERLTGLARELDGQVELLHTIAVYDTAKTTNKLKCERYFHEAFAAKHRAGEWFDLTDDDVAWARTFTTWNPEDRQR